MITYQETNKYTIKQIKIYSNKWETANIKIKYEKL